jgi:hypothetical protein
MGDAALLRLSPFPLTKPPSYGEIGALWDDEPAFQRYRDAARDIDSAQPGHANVRSIALNPR